MTENMLGIMERTNMTSMAMHSANPNLFQL
jgi:hypothetical protein